jgi:branched-chain amino acid transport system ATP-binding protein
MTARLACSDVTVKYGGLVALDNVSLEVAASSIVGLIGPNGAGKSTLFGVLSGLIRRTTSGTVLMDGADITHERPQLRAARGLARTFQHPELFPGLTVRDHFVLAYRVRNDRRRLWSDMFIGGSLHPVKAAERQRVDELIEMLGLQRVAQQPAIGLPLGVARLVELGRALATALTVLLLDEPSSGLNSAETEQFTETLLRVAADRGTSVLLVEHDVELVMRVCSSVYVLDFGLMIARGTPAEIRGSADVQAAYLGQESKTVAVTTKPRARSETSDRPSAMVVDKLCINYGDATALTDVSFSVAHGEALAVLGPNGAGKSSLARAVSGLVRPRAGRVVFDGKDIARWSAHRIRRAGIVHLPEGRGVFRGLSVMDNIDMAVASVSKRERAAAVDRAFATFPVLAERRGQLAGRLSGGEQQMLALARALATKPALVIADELSLGLAPKMVDLVFDALTQARDDGVTVVMIEQYVHRALAFADDVLVLQRGAVAWHGPSSAAGAEVLRHYLGETMEAAAG